MIIARAKDNNFTTELFLSDDKGVRPIYSGQPQSVGGLGTDFRPSQLLLAGYLSCMSVNIRNAMNIDNVKYEDVVITGELNADEEGVTKIYTKVEIISDVSEEIKQKYIEKGSSCYVKTLLSNEVKFFKMD